MAANQPIHAGRPTPNGDALSRLPTAQVREMREGFQILDRDNDGLVNRDDVVDMLTNLGTSWFRWGAAAVPQTQQRAVGCEERAADTLEDRSGRVHGGDVAVLPARGAADAASCYVPVDAVVFARAAVFADGTDQCVRCF